MRLASNQGIRVLELFVKFLEKLIELQKTRQESERKRYDDFVRPVLDALDKVHGDYLTTFRTYEALIADTTQPLNESHPVLSMLEVDSLYTLQLRAKLGAAFDQPNDDDILRWLADRLVRYSYWGLCRGHEELLEGVSFGTNQPRQYTYAGLKEILASNSEETQKRNRALLLVRSVVTRLQATYFAIQSEDSQVRLRLFDQSL